MKMVVVQAVAVNVQMYFATKSLGQKYWGYLFHQITCVAVLLVLSVCARLAGSAALGGAPAAFWMLVTSATLYIGAVGVVAFLAPTWLGVSRADVARGISVVLTALPWVRSGGRGDDSSTK